MPDYVVDDHPSPNFGPRKGDALIDTLVLHYTDTRTVADTLSILTDPDRQVSAHYLIGEEGEVFRLVREEDRAWHSGVSYWRGECDINSRSIGIELQNPGERFGYKPFPKRQMDVVIALCLNIMARWSIPQRNVVGHSDIACDRKQDPGHLFDWQGLAKGGVGIWPAAVHAQAKELPALLNELGYDPESKKRIEAFQRHYRPRNMDNLADDETASLAQGLLQSLGPAIT